VLCFLRWNNLKEAPNERIHSPLLLLPIELTKKKGVRDNYVLAPATSEAEVNPALRHHLKELYTYHDNLRKTLEASDNPEVKVLLSLVAFKLQASSVLNREVFEAALHECPDRLKMFVVRDYANAYTSHAQCYTERYDPELHEALVNATQLYLPELSDQLMWLQRTKPQTYSDQIKEAMTSTSAILSTAQSFAGPLATYATNLFAGSGTNALQPSQAASDNVSSGLRRSNDK